MPANLTSAPNFRTTAVSLVFVRRLRRVWYVLRAALVVSVLVALAVATAFLLRPMSVIHQVVLLRLRSQGVHSEYVLVGGHRVHYLVAGEGEPLVLVHGLGSKGEDWGSLIPVFARGGYKVYAIDLLGYGKSDQPADASYSIAQQAGIVRGFLEAKGLQRVNLAGWSMGGWVALKVAYDAPERLSRLLLFDSAGIRFDVQFDPAIFWPDTPEKLAHITTWLMPQSSRIPDFLARDMLRNVREHEWIIRRSFRAMETGNDLMDDKLSGLKMPVMIVWGSQDRVIPVTSAVVMHQEIPQSVLAVFDGCGHLAPEQCADRVGPKVLDFLHAQAPVASMIEYIPDVHSNPSH